MVNFRVTDDEYQRLQEAWTLSGAPHLSEFARTSVMEAVQRKDKTPDIAQPECRLRCDLTVPREQFPELQRLLESLIRAAEGAA